MAWKGWKTRTLLTPAGRLARVKRAAKQIHNEAQLQAMLRGLHAHERRQALALLEPHLPFAREPASTAARHINERGGGLTASLERPGEMSLPSTGDEPEDTGEELSE